MSRLSVRLKEQMRTPPLRFQVRGVRFLFRLNGRALLGDDMGLGKTYQALAWLVLHPEARPAVVVCPATVKLNWAREARHHARLRTRLLHGHKAGPLTGNHIWIINYDILQYWTQVLKATRPQVLVIDECHRIKNRKAKRTKATVELGRCVPHILALSGTPILSRPIEFFPVLNLINKSLFSSFWEYAFRYCDPHRGFRGRGWDFTGASHLDELHNLVTHIMLRRTKAEVLKDLPPKTRTFLPVQIDNGDEYAEARESFLEWLQEREGEQAVNRARGAVALVRLGALKRLAAEGKMTTALDWVQDWLNETDGKLVVFAIHRSIVAQVKASYPNAACVHGSVPMRERQTEVDRFQRDPRCRVFVGNLRAAGEGITLHAASTVLFLEVGWTPAEHEQAEDRVLRIGQKASHVDIYYMVASGTVEEETLDLIESKRQICTQVLDGKDAPPTRSSIASELLERMRRS